MSTTHTHTKYNKIEEIYRLQYRSFIVENKSKILRKKAFQE